MKPFRMVMTEFVMMGEASLNLPKLVRDAKILGQEPGRSGGDGAAQGSLARTPSLLKSAAAGDVHRGQKRMDANQAQQVNAPGASAVRRQKK